MFPTKDDIENLVEKISGWGAGVKQCNYCTEDGPCDDGIDDLRDLIGQWVDGYA